MAAPQNVYAFDFEIARQAARRWKDTEKAREQKVAAFDQNQFDKVDSKERLAKRYNRLASAIHRVARVADGDAEEALEGLPEQLSAEDIDNAAMERVIGASRDFLQFRYLSRALKAGQSVCRLVTRLGNGRVAFGTGFLVTPRLLLTNHHVLGSAQAAQATVAQFNYELDEDDRIANLHEFALEPALFFLNDKTHDFALAAVAGKSRQGAPASDFGYCRLIAAEGKIIPGERVNIVQHPKGEPKQVVVQENKLLDLPPKHDLFAHYEADTEPGSSGSPVFNDQWEVIALHHSSVPRTNANGDPLDKDGRVVRKGDDPSRIEWIGNEGIRVSRLLRFIAGATVAQDTGKLRDELLKLAYPDGPPPDANKPGEKESTETRKPPSDASYRPGATPRRPKPEPAPGTISMMVPLIVTVSLGTNRQEQSRFAAEPLDFQESGRPDDDYEDRPGYNPEFLGVAVPLPTLAGQRNGAASELKYFNYSVIFNPDRHLAFVSAVNFDAKARARHEREGGDKWFFDPRIAKDLQAGNALYASNKLDRGHLTRRADAAWGDTADAAERANNDTFHWTNCSPQHEIFNQSTLANREGVALWGNIENYIASEASREGKLIVFNGPVFRNGDRNYRGVKLPKEYWKIVVCRTKPNGLKAVAFKLSQEDLIRDLPEEEFQEGPYKPFQLKISELERLTKLNFGKLRNFDPLATADGESHLEADTGALAIESMADIVL